MTQAFLVVVALFLLVFVPLGVLAWRRSLLARFALRESTRRRGQLALLVVGLMAGSASVTAALVASDTQVHMLTSVWTQQLGAVDLTVTGTGGRPFSTDVAQRLAADPAVTPYVDGVQAGLEIHASIADLDQTLGKPDVLLVGFDPASQTRFGAFDLGGGHYIYGSELAQGDMLLSTDLASALGARVGDRLRVCAGSGLTTDLRVYGIAARRGPGAYSGFLVSAGYGGPLTAYLPLGTAQLLTGNTDINVVRIAARGGSPADVNPARLASSPLRAAVARIQSAASLTVNEARVELERQAAATSANVTGTYLAFTSLIALAAMALIVNLVIALAEERRPRLAVLRALGLSRTGLVVASILEGAVYSLASGIAGLVVGVPAGIYLAQQAWNTILLDPSSQIAPGLSLQLTIRPDTLALAFAAGALLTLATVAATAYRTSRMAISAAIRDLPEPAPAPGRRWPRIALLLALAVIGAGLIIPDYAPGRMVGGFLLITAAAGLARGRLPDRDRATVFGLGITALTALTVAAYSRSLSDENQLIIVLVLAVAMPAVGLSIVAAANLRLVDAGLGRLGNRFSQVQAALRPPLAYLSRRPLRTGLAASAFAIVLALTTVLAVFAGSVGVDYNRESAGFDVLAVSSAGEPIQLPADVEEQVTSRMTLPMRIYRGPLSGTGYIGSHTLTEMIFYVLPNDPSDRGPVALDNLDPRFPTSSAAWQAVRSEPNLVIGTGGASPGDEVVVSGKSGPLHLRLTAVPSSFILNGIVASATTMANLDTTAGGSTVLLTLRPGADTRAIAHEIARAGFAQGVQATSIRDMLDRDVASNVAWTTMLDGLLHMGLLVGVLALAMIGLRAAVERRRPIGILRALGYQPPTLLMGLLAEAALLATLGVLAGVGGGLVIAYFVRDIAVPPGTPFGVDLPRIAIALAIVYSTVVLVTGPLASRAARLAPAEAVRLIG